ncbi:lactate utilization protein C [Brevibacterium luteolum]|uniref:LutC/YkgG family protein n=1 Tax=Brevibacterium luteolum TaxID=199591 RepID=UPI00223BE467|nr:LUD domain-containing protein [Brevibacterium luteolum]MCT1656498.1 LUD domain-containing protein [Brevibacterium luteolum]
MSEQTASAKAEILARIRGALVDNPQPAAPVRNYRQRGSADPQAVREMFIDRIVDYKARAFVETAQTVAGRIAELLGEDTRHVVPEGFPVDWLPSDGPVGERIIDTADQPLSHAELDAVDAVVTSSTVSCAETGTVFLNAGPAEGRRAISLIPDHHICVVPADSLVELVPEALARIDHSQPVTMFSGPSATSDIELQRVEGVHGPRKVDIIILD